VAAGRIPARTPSTIGLGRAFASGCPPHPLSRQNGRAGDGRPTVGDRRRRPARVVPRGIAPGNRQRWRAPMRSRRDQASGLWAFELRPLASGARDARYGRTRYEGGRGRFERAPEIKPWPPGRPMLRRQGLPRPPTRTGAIGLKPLALRAEGPPWLGPTTGEAFGPPFLHHRRPTSPAHSRDCRPIGPAA
jgi:hypothetical protein